MPQSRGEMTMPEPAERRRFPRFQIQVPFLYTAHVPIPAVWEAGWTRSLGESGATVELSDRLRPRTAVQLRLRAEQGVVEVEAGVIWSGERVSEGGLVHGLSFTHIGRDDAQVLRKIFRPLPVMRRGGVRLPLDVPITCRPKNLAGTPLQGRTEDVTRGGLMLRLPRLVPPGTPLEVTLHAAKEPLTVDGVVVWVEPPEIWKPGESIGHGFQFTAPGWNSLAYLGLLAVKSS